MKSGDTSVDMDGVDPVEKEFKRLKGALLALNTVFEAARIGRSGRLMSMSAWAGDMEDLLQLAADTTLQD